MFPQNSHAEALTSSVMSFGDVTFRRGLRTDEMLELVPL
jgi:hypothetical protein